MKTLIYSLYLSVILIPFKDIKEKALFNRSSVNLVFETDTTLQIQYFIPSGFKKLSKEEMKKYHDPKRQDDIHKMYKDQNSDSYMLVSILEKDKWNQYLQYQELNDYPENWMWNDFNISHYQINLLEVQQITMKNKEWVNLKLLFSNQSNYFQVDYLVPMVLYQDNMDLKIQNSITSFSDIKLK